jgi:hypothetical protein
LREHLRDAVAGHKAAGLSEEAALERALQDFGGPDEVRSELEAAHGHRLMPVVIDKAMQWKEMTMKAKWLWTTWAYLALVIVLALEVLSLVFAGLFIIPKYQKLLRDGIIDPAILREPGVGWMHSFLMFVNGPLSGMAMWYVILPPLAWGLFEWRVKSENKPFMRLSALGTAAVVLIVLVALTFGSLVVSFAMGVPPMARLALPYAVDQIAKIDTSITAIEQAQAKKDWDTMQAQADQAAVGLANLVKAPSAIPALANNSRARVAEEVRSVEELQEYVKTAGEALGEAQRAIHDKDASRLETAMRKLHEAFAPVQAAAKKPAA